jgi:hypothetical protein
MTPYASLRSIASLRRMHVRDGRDRPLRVDFSRASPLDFFEQPAKTLTIFLIPMFLLRKLQKTSKPLWVS